MSFQVPKTEKKNRSNVVFGNRLKMAMEEQRMSAHVLASRIDGLHHSSIYRYFDGMEPGAFTLELMAQELGVSVDWLLTGREAPEQLTHQQAVHLDKMFAEKVGGPEDNCLVPRIKGEVAAGSPRIMEDDILDFLTFKASFLAKIPKNTDRPEDKWQRFVLANVDRLTGWSMWPIMMPGDTLLIDRHCTLPMPFKKGAKAPTRRPIYAVKHDGGVTVKFVDFGQAHGLLVLIPENPEYNAEIIQMERGKVLHDYIVGRVAWIGRALD